MPVCSILDVKPPVIRLIGEIELPIDNPGGGADALLHMVQSLEPSGAMGKLFAPWASTRSPQQPPKPAEASEDIDKSYLSGRLLWLPTPHQSALGPCLTWLLICESAMAGVCHPHVE